MVRSFNKVQLKEATIIESIVQYATGFDKFALRSHSRKSDVTFARHLAYYLLYEFFGWQYVEIGGYYGKNHATIMNAVAKINDIRYIYKSTRKAKLIEDCILKISDASSVYDISNSPNNSDIDIADIDVKIETSEKSLNDLTIRIEALQKIKFIEENKIAELKAIKDRINETKTNG